MHWVSTRLPLKYFQPFFRVSGRDVLSRWPTAFRSHAGVTNPRFYFSLLMGFFFWVFGYQEGSLIALKLKTSPPYDLNPGFTTMTNPALFEDFRKGLLRE